MDALAASTLAGIDPLTMLRAGPMERALLIDVAERAWQLTMDRDAVLARRIINELAQAMRK